MTRWIAPLLLAAATATLAAASAPVNTGKSRITATFTQMNVAVEGSFQMFSGEVAYDPANVAASSASISVDTASFDLGDEEYNAEVRKKEWLDASAHKTATFKSTSIKPLGPGKFEAEGTLTLKGKSQPAKSTVTVKPEGTAQRFDGEITVSRSTFAIGDAEWNDVLADAVVVKFSIVAP
ncbi:MAG TPA: YceI family protein [Nevskiaceae bacterium]|nr:YceI family protein [Nevskiaceae bacterium]